MDDYKKYLAQQLLTEDKLVTYRSLSRALKVHVNTAKQMLYEFHKSQNAKQAGSLHATYLIYGTKKRTAEANGDVEMTDSQSEDVPLPQLSDEVPIHTLVMVKEEDLENVLGEYDEVTSIHVYSLAPHPLKDLQLLADTARQVLTLTIAEPSLDSLKAYGTITNPNTRRRERKGPPPPQAASAAAAAPVKAEPKAESKPAAKQEVQVKEEPKPAQPASSAPAAKKLGPTSLKRQGSSDIGGMFAKAAAKKPAPKPAKPAEEVPSPALSDDGEDEDEPMTDVKQETNTLRQSRKDRQAELRRMMDESDDEEPEKADSPAAELEEEEVPEPEPEPKKEEQPKEVVSSTGDGRKRGKRKVTKKKQVMDKDGYLVTQNETVWESFSEDEAPPPKAKPAVSASNATSNANKSKKPAAKGGQGNIKNFFAKK